MKKIHFIVNPISGNGRQLNELNKILLNKSFPHEDFDIHLSFTRKRGDTAQFVKEAIIDKADIIVACGGDGTISEVASHLVNTEITLGIIPRGSGNGLATHLKIPKDINSALQIIKNGQHTSIDVGRAGEHYFFSNCGTGFAAEVIHQYDKIPDRKLPGYIKAGLASLPAISNGKLFDIRIGDLKFSSRHLFISNSNIMGYNMTLTPDASLEDGLFDIVALPYRTLFGFGIFSIMALFRSHHLLKKVEFYNSDSVHLATEEKPFIIQIDGEALEINDNKLEISLLPKALNIIIP